MDKNSPALEHHLRRNAVGALEAGFMGITHSSIAADAASLLIGAVAFALGALPLAMLIGLVIYVLILNVNYQLSKRITSAGGYYTYVTKAFGGHTGLYALWGDSIFEIYAFSLFGALGFATTIFYYFPGVSSIRFIWVPIFLGVLAVQYFIAYRGIIVSIRFMFITAGAEVLFLSISSLVILLKTGFAGIPTSFSLVPVHYSGTLLLFGALFAAFSLTGTVAPVSLGHEIKRPTRNLPLALVAAFLIAGITIMLVSMALVSGWGIGNMASFATYANPGQIVWTKWLGSVGGILFAVFVLNSYFGVGIAAQTDISRMWFAAAKEGMLLPSSFGRVHPKYKSPNVILTWIFVISIIVTLPVALWLGPLNATIVFAIPASLAWLSYKLLTAISVPVIVRKMKDKVKIITHIVLPAALIIFIGLLIYSTVVPIPPPPSLYGLIAYPILLIAGAVVAEIFLKKHKNSVKNAGSYIITKDDEEEVEAK